MQTFDFFFIYSKYSVCTPNYSCLQVGTTKVFSGHNPVIKVMLMIGQVGKLALLLLTSRMTAEPILFTNE